MNRFCQEHLHLAADWWWYHDFTTGRVEVSDTTKHFLGFEPQELKTREDWEKIVHPEDLPNACSAAEKAALFKQPQNVRIRYTSKEGAWMTLFCKMQPLVREDTVAGMLGINRKIDDVLAVEAEILQRNEDLVQVASILSHDFRGPARHMAGCNERVLTQLDALREKIEKGRPLRVGDLDELERWANLGKSSSERMGKMIEHVLQYSRAGTKGVHVENVDAWDVVQDVLRDYAERIDERGVQMKVSCLPVVLYDRTMLYLVLANLISNAIKFSKKTDTAPLVEVFGKNTSMGHVSIVVRDHGIGIPVQYTEKILDMGFRLHHESEYAGFGYGLAIVRKILKRCGGELGIRSKLNEGSDFVVTLLAGKNTQT